MASIRLILINRSLLAAMDAGDAALAERFGIRVAVDASFVRELVQSNIQFQEAVPRDSALGCFLAADRVTGAIVAAGGFKSGPKADGSIEIAYCCLPSCEGKGYATALAGELVRLARQSPAVNRVIAHTLPERNASCRVLEKNGMTCVGEVIDPEDGKVWRWELPTQ